MSRNHREEPVVGFSVVLLFGCILIGIGLTLPPPQTSLVGYHSGKDTWTCVLSNETPTSTFDLDPSVISVEIVSLTANDSVNLLVFVDSAVALNCTNVTSMSQVAPQISAQAMWFWEDTNMSIEVCRAENDAWMHMELRTLTQWYAVVDYPMTVYWAPYFLVAAGAVLSLYSLWHLASIERRHVKVRQSHVQVPDARSRISPAMIALLIVLGGLLSVPVVRGVLLDEYALVTVVENVSSGEATFRLNESFPSGGLELANLCPSTGTNYTIELQITVSAGLPVIISVSGAQGHEEFTLENCTDSDRWLLKFEARADESKQVWFEKPTGIADVDCQYVVKGSVTGPRTNPIPPLLIGSVGTVLFLCGLISARKRNQLLQTTEPQQTTDVVS